MKQIVLVVWIVFLCAPWAPCRELSLERPPGTLYATLELPPISEGPQDPRSSPAAVLIIAGSGPTDRNGNNPLAGSNNCLKLLAQGLAREGIPSLRYDKRFSGASMLRGMTEADIRCETFIQDAVAWGEVLERECPGKLVVLGHSQGALVGAVAARRLAAVGYVSLAGAGRSIDAVIRCQLEKQLPPDLFRESCTILKTLRRGEMVETPPPVLAPIFRPTVQPFLISWMQYDPVSQVEQLACPLLVVQGGLDVQVEASEAEALVRACPHARYHLVAGMNHVLKDVSTGPQLQVRSYREPDLPLAPGLVGEIAAFVKNL